MYHFCGKMEVVPLFLVILLVSATIGKNATLSPSPSINTPAASATPVSPAASPSVVPSSASSVSPAGSVAPTGTASPVNGSMTTATPTSAPLLQTWEIIIIAVSGFALLVIIILIIICCCIRRRRPIDKPQPDGEAKMVAVENGKSPGDTVNEGFKSDEQEGKKGNYELSSETNGNAVKEAHQQEPQSPSDEQQGKKGSNDLTSELNGNAVKDDEDTAF